MTARKQRLTVTVDPELVEAGQRAVESGEADSVSGWVSAALEDKIRRDRKLALLAAAVADYESEFGEISAQEIVTQRRADREDAVVVRGARVTRVLDSGALVALERNERQAWIRLKAAQLADGLPVTHAGVLGQVWRGGPRQSRLSKALAGVDVRALDEPLGRAAGQLLAATGLDDVVAAAVVLLATDGDEIVTVDRGDFELLVAASGRHVELLHP